ncbi:MAG: alpha amylase C-terminal domain-containing protein [Muribaculaceae bacterium]|nr:alpha amylase C-terminal domain-containing protein [Muribaculaceae bacterium]
MNKGSKKSDNKSASSKKLKTQTPTTKPTTRSSTSAERKTTRRPRKPRLNILRNDPWLMPFAEAIEGRHQDAISREKQILGESNRSLSEFANAHLYFGLHRNENGEWVFREWAPGARAIWLIGDFSGWQRTDAFKLQRLDGGVWQGTFPHDAIHPNNLYKMFVEWDGGSGERIPAYATRVVQDNITHIFSAQVPDDHEYKWQSTGFIPDTKPLLIYECHIGMAQDREDVGTYDEFRTNVLPRIAADGYNAIQIMAIQEHPYYGSFGYHVSNFFAPSSRFGTANELKRLIDEAHGLGIAVIMDIVHSHAVKNEAEGIARLDGSCDLYFHKDPSRREHPAWDSLCFDYGKTEVLHFLLSNCKYWLEEFRFDGFRFDGVTSMLYYNHGLGQAFGGYEDYYNGNQDTDAIVYLTLANKLIHSINPNAITIAEEMSGMPGLATPIKDGGMGFDYRMAMGIPDYWIKTLKEKKDEDWHPTSIFWELTNRRADEKTISYVESHDQALVGDKTVIFRLIDDHMYWHMSRDDNDDVVNRGIALHKMIRLVTLATINGGYLNFMGNEFGHPEWIDFPREGNGWSHKYARRQWSLVDNPDLKYQYLNAFDNAMIEVVSHQYDFQALPIRKLWEKDDDQILAFMRGDLVFVFNFNPTHSFTDYGILIPAGRYDVVLSSDDLRFGGFGNVYHSVPHLTMPDRLYAPAGVEWLKLYIPSRTAIILRRHNDNMP